MKLELYLVPGDIHYKALKLFLMYKLVLMKINYYSVVRDQNISSLFFVLSNVATDNLENYLSQLLYIKKYNSKTYKGGR